MEERSLHSVYGAKSALARVSATLEQLDPVERLIEERERRDAMRDVQRRRLDASQRVGYEGRRVLP